MDTADTPTANDAPAAPEAATPPAEAAVALSGAALIDTLDKDGLAEFMAAEFPGRALDMRKRLDTLRAEAKALLDGSTQKAEAAEAAEVAKVEARAASTPVKARHKFLTNPATGEPWEFKWTAAYAKNADLEPIYED